MDSDQVILIQVRSIICQHGIDLLTNSKENYKTLKYVHVCSSVK